MLILERKVHERVMLTGGIIITISDIDTRTKKVKLGFEAPDEINIVREEVLIRDLKHGKLNGV